MAEYSYLVADLLTNQITAELPLTDVTFGRVLRGAGPMSATLALGDARIRALDPIANTAPGRTALYIDRDGVLQWGGIIWTRRYDSASEKLEVAGSEFWSYFAHRLKRSTTAFVSVDQASMVAALIEEAQSAIGGDIGVTIDAALTTVLRDRTYYGYELKPYAEAVEQLAAVIDGFDFAIDVDWGDAGPVKTLRVDYPRRGVQAFETSLLFDLPGNILSYAWPEDATRMADDVLAIGAGEGDDMLLATAQHAAAFDAGYPLLEAARSYKDVRISETLEEHAQADVEAAGLPITIPGLTIRGDGDPSVGAFDIGDDCRIAISDARHPDGIDVFARILGFAVQPATDSSIETVTLNLGEVAE